MSGSRRRSSCPRSTPVNDVATNKDSSIDLWFGPEKPGDAPDMNWIQIAPTGTSWSLCGSTGTGTAFFDQTWKPDDVVKVQ